MVRKNIFNIHQSIFNFCKRQLIEQLNIDYSILNVVELRILRYAFVPVRNGMLVESNKRMGCSGQEQHVLIEERLYSKCIL